MVLGIVGLVLFFTVVFGFICGVLAVIFGAIGRSRARSGLANNEGQATAGLVTGLVAVVLAIAVLAVFIPGGHYCVHVGSQSQACP
jgi:uncharacterized membrane protein